MVKKSKFLKGIDHGFCQKLEILRLFLFQENKLKKGFYHVLLGKKAILENKNVDLLMVKKSKFVKGIAHGFCQKLKILKLFLFELLRC